MYFIYNRDTGIVIDKAHNPIFCKLREKDMFKISCSQGDIDMAGVIFKDIYYPLNYESKYICQQCYEDDEIFTRSENVSKYEDILPNYTMYYLDTNAIDYFKNDLNYIRHNKQEENKAAFNNYLLAHPYEYNGKQYGTTLQDQLEINLMLSQAQAMDEEPQVEWHATTEVNESMSVSDLLAIQAGIKNAVAAPYKKMQEYKKAIFDCTDAKILVEMSFEYEGDENA